MLITITTHPPRDETLAFRASDVAAVRQMGDAVCVFFSRGHALAGSWSVSELHAPGLRPMLRPTLEGVIDFINITTTPSES